MTTTDDQILGTADDVFVSLARLEGGVVFERLLARFPDLAGDTTPVWSPSLTLRGLETLQVSVR